MVNSDAPNRNSPSPRKSAVGCSAKGRSLVAVTLGLVHALGLVGACGWIAVFVLLLLALIRGMNLSGTLITDISGVLTALIGAILRCSRTLCRSTRDHKASEGNTEHAISHENIKSHFCLSLLERAYCWLL